jgi:hypothetical protein
MKMLSEVCPTCGRRKPRSVQQNRRYFELLTLASEKLGHNKNIWHEYFKQKFLPCKIIKIGHEEKLIPYSTSDLPMHPDLNKPNDPNWETYTLYVESWLSERGVYLAD